MLSLLALTQRWIVPTSPVLLCRRTVLLAAAAVFFLPSGAQADIHTAKQRGKLGRDIVASAPASAIPDSEEIDPGGQVEITLVARGAGNKAVKFDFATQPQHGALTGFHIISSNKAVVTYVHDPDSGPGHDEFTYRVQATGLEMSGPVKVDITIREYPPQLAVSPAEVDFGAVKAGEVARGQVTVRNNGGGLATGRLDLPEPWDVEGSAEFRLGAGEKQVFHLIFKPQNDRSFSETVRVGDAGIGAQRNAALHLIGTGLGGPAEKQFAGINGVPPAAAAENPGATVPPEAVRSTPAGVPVTPKPALAGNNREGTANRPPSTSSGTGAGSSAAENPSGASGGTQGGDAFVAPEVYLNEASVKRIVERSHGRNQLQIAWREPQPRPAKYRVELRRLSMDSDDNLVVSWLPSSKVSYQVKDGIMTASVSGLPADTNQTVRVVAIDAAGHFAAPSPWVEIRMDPPSSWWKLSFLQWMMVAAAICGFLAIRNRLQNNQLLAQLDEERAERRRVEA